MTQTYFKKLLEYSNKSFLVRAIGKWSQTTSIHGLSHAGAAQNGKLKLLWSLALRLVL